MQCVSGAHGVRIIRRFRVDSAYKGCVVFRFSDFARGKLEQGTNAHPVPVVTASVSKDSFNGACTFLPACANKGLLIGQVEFVVRDKKPDAIFHIFRSNIAP